MNGIDYFDYIINNVTESLQKIDDMKKKVDERKNAMCNGYKGIEHIVKILVDNKLHGKDTIILKDITEEEYNTLKQYGFCVDKIEMYGMTRGYEVKL